MDDLNMDVRKIIKFSKAYTVSKGDGELFAIGRPSKSRDFLHAINCWVDVLPVFELHLVRLFSRKYLKKYINFSKSI